MCLDRNTAGRTTVQKQCASTAVTMAPATIVGAIGCTAHVSARWLRMRGRTNMKLITVAGRIPPQMVCKENLGTGRTKIMKTIENMLQSQKMSEFFKRCHIS